MRTHPRSNGRESEGGRGDVKILWLQLWVMGCGEMFGEIVSRMFCSAGDVGVSGVSK